MKVHHIAVRARDVTRVAMFYRERLELTELSPPREGVAWFELAGTILMIEPLEESVSDEDSDRQRPGLHLLALAIEPSERLSWIAKLGEWRIPIERETAYSLYVRDPEGNRVALSHYPLEVR